MADLVSQADLAPADAAAAAVGSPDGTADDAAPPASTWSFSDWANAHGIGSFAKLLDTAGLTSFIEGSEAPLTIFAPGDEALAALSSQLPTDTQLLRELLCVHITMGGLRCARPSNHGPACHPCLFFPLPAHLPPPRLAAAPSSCPRARSPPSASRRTTSRSSRTSLPSPLPPLPPPPRAMRRPSRRRPPPRRPRPRRRPPRGRRCRWAP